MTPIRTRRAELDDRVEQSAFLLELFDHVPEVVVFVKDADLRYSAVNETLVRRLGLHDKWQVVGRTALDLFPPPLGGRYLAQDQAVLRSGNPISNLLELHLYPNGHQGWCVTTKVPVRDARGDVIGLAGTSRDVSLPDPAVAPSDDLAEAVRVIREEFARPLRVNDLAARAGLSAYQFSRRIHELFGLTPAKLLIKTRVDAACRMLVEGECSISEIAQACGYCDQSAFTRQFKAVVGLPPARYRDHRKWARERP
jgi:PAS domain S-box-containing protein